MKWIESLNQLPIVLGIFLVIVGFIMYRFPPKNINFFIGYRTPRSMMSQQHWDFSQKYAASEMMRSGIALLPISLLGLITEVPDFAMNIIIIVFILVPILRTEIALRKKFPSIKQ